TQPTLNQLTLFAEGSPARICPSRAVVRAWLEHGQDSGGSSTASWLAYVPGGLLSRTSLAFCRATEDGTWEPSSGRWGTWGMGGPTECWTLSGSDWPSDGSACSLSDVLETQPVPPRFYLSPKAASGILRRAERRGRSLPPSLRAALEQAALATSEPKQTSS